MHLLVSLLGAFAIRQAVAAIDIGRIVVPYPRKVARVGAAIKPRLE
jgi:hypothetical protein